MDFYDNEKIILLDKTNLEKHFEEQNTLPSPKICILIHGLLNNETVWDFKDKSNYGSFLNQELGYTAFYLRYNSGLHISDNGKALTTILEQFYDNYPIEIEEISIIAHSMGGLVTHSACFYAQKNGLKWTTKLKNIFLLATPHLGSYLEKFANVTTHILAKVPNWHTRMVGKILNLRSSGIKDLRFGYVTEDDWKDEQPDSFLKNTKKNTPKLLNTTYYIISARLTEKEKHWMTQLFGDILVSTRSATAQSKNTEGYHFPTENHFAFAKTYHFQLMTNRAVYEKIKEWLING
jgi:triacylglycerol lipase